MRQEGRGEGDLKSCCFKSNFDLLSEEMHCCPETNTPTDDGHDTKERVVKEHAGEVVEEHGELQQGEVTMGRKGKTR
jgi:hypothetical protein